jgi:hypothetical protein
MDFCSLKQLVRVATRKTATLDLILVNDSSLVSGICTNMSISNSDHSVVKCYLHLPTYTSREEKWPKCVRLYSKTDWSRLSESLHIDWQAQIGDCDVTTGWQRFRAICDVAVNELVPKTTRTPRHRSPWYTAKVHNARKEKQMRWSAYKQNPSEHHYENYKKARNAYTNVARIAICEYEESLSHGDASAFFKYARTRRQAKEAPLALDKNGITQYDKQFCAEEFNQFFVSVFNKPQTYDNPNIEGSKTTVVKKSVNFLRTLPIAMQDVYATLRDLKEKKSPGPDDIPNILLKRCRESLAWPLSILYKKSLDEGRLPQDWRDAIVAPIYKKGNKTVCENYRPVSLTSTVVKVMEKLLCKHIVSHIEANGLIHRSQYGFRRNLNCEFQLAHYLDTVTKLVDDGNSVDVIYLDMQKAFDKVPHRELLKKLEDEFFITGNAKRWLQAYLHGRRQRVRVGHVLSEWSSVTSGVPQGSILGPILFIMYINDMDTVLNNATIYKFADDTKVVSTANTTEDCDCLQKNIAALEEWSNKWKMPFNSRKSAVMHFGKGNARSAYSMNGDLIPDSDVERDLGVYVDSNLNFSTHIDTVVGKARKLCGWIHRVYITRNTDVLLRLYTTVVRPVLEYASVIWSPDTRAQIDKIEKVQRQFTKRIRTVRSLPYIDRLTKLNLESLEVRRNSIDIAVTRSMLSGTFSHLKSMFRLRRNDCLRPTRGHVLSMSHVRCNTAVRKRFLTNRVIKAWNGMPKSVVDEITGNC